MMKKISSIALACLLSFIVNAQGRLIFNSDKDLLLAHFDCKTDVDDVHSIGAFYMLLSHTDFENVKYHAVTGTYGTQEGLYVPPNDLFELVYDRKDWSDAHSDRNEALGQAYYKVAGTLMEGGHIWIADAGQSDFSAAIVRMVQDKLPMAEYLERIHVVQHSDWNEEVTTEQDLLYLKKTIDYQKIADGNALDNGTPGFRTPDFNWKNHLASDQLTSMWQLAVNIGDQYNGVDGRYLNEAIKEGGLDFSDMSEVCWILGIEDIRDTQEFFNIYGR